MAARKKTPKSKWARAASKAKKPRKPALSKKQEAAFFHLLGGGSRDDIPE